MRALVTGGAGFIGSALTRHIVGRLGWSTMVVDKLTYAGHLSSLAQVADAPGYSFVQADICNRAVLDAAFAQAQPDIVFHLAAESHVDRSIDSADDFIRTNINGTFVLLEEARRYCEELESGRRGAFRFHHISTDEVFGELGPTGKFTETTPYDPSSPYSASKAASDHLVRAWGRTYGLPVLLTNCSNNYGPYQFPEKLVPLMILRALHGQTLPVYGTGDNVRDWLHVDDHAAALFTVLTRAEPGSTYNVGCSSERRNLDMVEAICDLVDEFAGPLPSGPRRSLISFVTDRPGHDKRYAIDAVKLTTRLGWKPAYDLDAGLRQTVQWYLDNEAWWGPLLDQKGPLKRRGLTTSITDPARNVPIKLDIVIPR